MYDYEELMIVDSGYHLRGLFSYVNQVLANLYIADKEGKALAVDLHHTPYNQNDKGSNAWKYFFQQPFNLKNEDLENIKNIKREVWFDGNLSIPPIFDNDLRIECNRLIKKYIKIKSNILDLKNDFKKLYIKTSNYASIHFRGTDKGSEWIILEKDFFYSKIEKMYNDYEKILVCSDEQEFIDESKKKFGDKIVAYPSFRAKFNSPNSMIHFNNKGFEYKSGEDVLIESLLMSEGKFLYRTPSNVTQFSIFNNIELLYENVEK
jgi:hypothetical protein